jgi:hypothetical protein
MTALTWIILLGGVAIVAVGAYLYGRPRPPREEVFYHYQCRACERKLRYRAARAGKQGICPRCKARFTFPLTPVVEEPKPSDS